MYRVCPQVVPLKITNIELFSALNDITDWRALNSNSMLIFNYLKTDLGILICKTIDVILLKVKLSFSMY